MLNCNIERNILEVQMKKILFGLPARAPNNQVMIVGLQGCGLSEVH